MSIPESMKQITEAAEKLIAPADIQSSFIISEEQLKKQERRIIFQSDAPDKTELVLGDDFEIKVENGKTFVVRKEPQYPKTYEECCEVLGKTKAYQSVSGYKTEWLEDFQKLLICRDAYWKIEGEQMGLGKPWEPDWNNLSTNHEFIKINKGCFTYLSRVLVFPTKEMRDTFYENFKDLIEACKELL